MTALDQLRDALDQLEDALGAAGLALDRAWKHANPAEVRAFIRAYGIAQRPKCQRLLWLEDHAALQRWHRGEEPSSLAHDLAHQSRPVEAET